MAHLKKILRSLAPRFVLSAYHFSLAYLGALRYALPSRSITVIGVTGTNGKSSTIEFINAVFEEAGFTTALSSSIRIKVADSSSHATGRSMPGRFFIQHFLRRAVSAACSVAIIEMTSEGAAQHRHRGIALDALVFLNLAPEHIEAHGSYEAYADAKFKLGQALARSPKRPRIMIANTEDAQSARYLALPIERAVGFSVPAHAPTTNEQGGSFTFNGVTINVHLPGAFYLENALAAAELAHAFGIDTPAIKRGIERIDTIPGRMQRIDEGQQFSVIVDYALTPDALEALYKTFAQERKIAVFGSAGGGRDVWKRPVLGSIAERYCEHVILTNDIAYDESPDRILLDLARDMHTKPEIIPDRRLAMRRAFELARSSEPEHAVVLITGMGIDTELTSANGEIIPWSDEHVAREELKKILA